MFGKRPKYVFYCFCFCFLLAIVVSICKNSAERADVWWPAGAQTAWCYWQDQSRDDLICFR